MFHSLVVQVWRDHSLSIVLLGSGTALCLMAWACEPGKLFDTLLTFGGGLLTVGVFYLAAGPLHEENRPEE